MTKRIFAIVLALVMSLSLFTIDAFAAISVTATVSGSTVTVRWSAQTGASKYVVELSNAGGLVRKTETSTTSVPFTELAAGQYNVTVSALTSTGALISADSTTATVGSVTNTPTTTGGVFNNGTNLSWAPVDGATSYMLVFYSGTSVSGSRTVNEQGVFLNQLPTGITKVEVYAIKSNGTSTLVGSSTLGYSGGTGTTGAVSINGQYIIWSDTATTTYTVTFYGATNNVLATYSGIGAKSITLTAAPAGSVLVVVTRANGSSVGTCNLTTYGGLGTTTGNVYITGKTADSVTIAWTNMGASVYFVKYTNKITGQTSTVSAGSTTATIPVLANTSVDVEITVGNGTYQGQKLTATVSQNGITNVSGGLGGAVNSGNLYITKSDKSSTVTWAPVAGAVLYQVTYKKLSDTSATTLPALNTTNAVIPLGSNETWTVSVTAWINGVWKEIGSSVVMPSNSSTSGTTINGSNCTVTAGTTTSTVTWAGSVGTTYTVVYSPTGKTAGTLTTYSNTIQVPAGTSTGFTVYVISNNQIIAHATVNKAAGSSSSSDDDVVVDNDTDVDVAEDTVTGFWAETLGDGVVKLTWNAVEDVDTYKVYYRKVGATKWSGGHSRTKTYLSIDFGSKTSTYEFKIVAGSEESTILTLKPSAAKGTVAWAMNPEADAKFETNLAGVVKDADDGKITLTWEEVANAKYTVYYRKAGTTTWKGAYERNSESITITFKASNIDDAYEIMIKAGSKESDVFTIKPAVWTNAD